MAVGLVAKPAKRGTTMLVLVAVVATILSSPGTGRASEPRVVAVNHQFLSAHLERGFQRMTSASLPPEWETARDQTLDGFAFDGSVLLDVSTDRAETIASQVQPVVAGLDFRFVAETRNGLALVADYRRTAESLRLHLTALATDTFTTLGEVGATVSDNGDGTHRLTTEVDGDQGEAVDFDLGAQDCEEGCDAGSAAVGAGVALACSLRFGPVFRYACQVAGAVVGASISYVCQVDCEREYDAYLAYQPPLCTPYYCDLDLYGLIVEGFVTGADTFVTWYRPGESTHIYTYHDLGSRQLARAGEVASYSLIGRASGDAFGVDVGCTTPVRFSSSMSTSAGAIVRADYVHAKQVAISCV